ERRQGHAQTQAPGSVRFEGIESAQAPAAEGGALNHGQGEESEPEAFSDLHGGELCAQPRVLGRAGLGTDGLRLRLLRDLHRRQLDRQNIPLETRWPRVRSPYTTTP